MRLAAPNLSSQLEDAVADMPVPQILKKEVPPENRKAEGEEGSI
jgi:hypothetical protein